MYNGLTPDIDNPMVQMPWWMNIVIVLIVGLVTYIIYRLVTNRSVEG